MTRPISPYHKPGFYAEALAKGRHRDVVGGRWDETGRAQMALLQAEGLRPHHLLLDIGAGSLRLGCKAVPYLDPDHYWATDLSLPLMQRGHQTELPDPDRLHPDHLVEDPDFSFPGIPPTIQFAIAFAVFTHLPLGHLHHALTRIHASFPHLDRLLFTVFLSAQATHATALRQPDGVVTHPDRAPYHHLPADILHLTQTTGFIATLSDTRLPRGQILCVASRSTA
ncbi:MAG: class I SAM-dependent methyltransferase [bacterium]